MMPFAIVKDACRLSHHPYELIRDGINMAAIEHDKKMKEFIELTYLETSI